MKRIILLLFFSFLLFSCDKDEEAKIFSADATLYVDSSGVDNCKYALQTADNQWFAMERIPRDLQEAKVNVAIEFRKTNEYIDCGFGGSLPKIIILDLKVIQKAELDISGKIIEDTCGGTVIEVFNTEIGEEWINIFGNYEFYGNAVLSDLKLEGDLASNQLVIFNFRQVGFFNGNYCDIGGLPDTKIEILEIDSIAK